MPLFSTTVTEVDLSFNEIATWSFLDHLELVFPGLTSLRVSHNPLYANLQAADGRSLSAEDGYMLTLARMGRLKTLNYSPITDKERLNAESYYLSIIAKEINFAPESMREQVLASHPRYKWLCEEYGEPVLQRAGAVKPNSLAARLIRFRFRLGERAKELVGGDAKEGFEMELPMSFTVYSLLGVVGRRLGIAPWKCKLVWETGDWMPLGRSAGMQSIDEWDSDSLDEEDENQGPYNSVMREVEIIAGTRLVGTWIDGTEAIVRVEIHGL
jgi:tubulin-specific chaperone E